MRILLFLGALLMSLGATAEIYKTVDENGNVIYTDQKPVPDAEPLDLPELNVAEPHRPAPAPAEFPDDNGVDWSLFDISSPEPEENIWGTGNDLTVEISVPEELDRDMRIVIYLDGKAHDAGQSLNYTIEQVDRGEHRLRAELLGRGDRRIARTESRVIYIKQYSTNFQNNRNRGN
ncbi:MAG: DUF4124 domain-containing protein [Wenzhouxiangellaceae bacterium]